MIKIINEERCLAADTSSARDFLSRLDLQEVLVSRYRGLQKEACVMAMIQYILSFPCPPRLPLSSRPSRLSWRKVRPRQKTLMIIHKRFGTY